MTNVFEATHYFMRAAGQLDYVGFPEDVSHPVRQGRIEWLTEEFEETILAEATNNVVEVADGLADIIVIAIGSMFQYFGPETTYKILDEVARSNLDKIGPDGQVIRREDGKIQKPLEWEPPDILGLLVQAGIAVGGEVNH